jgi:hypothetical protein
MDLLHLFEEVLRRKSKTPPDSLVLRIIDGKQFTGAAVE